MSRAIRLPRTLLFSIGKSYLVPVLSVPLPPVPGVTLGIRVL